MVLQVTSNAYPSSILLSRGCQSWLHTEACFCRKFDSIWVIIDRLTRSAHFIAVNIKFRAEKYAEIYIAHVLCLHGVPKMIISDRVSQFVTRFWEQLHASLETHLIHSLAYHPQTDDQTERVNQIL
jgi:hypothetical protein